MTLAYIIAAIIVIAFIALVLHLAKGTPKHTPYKRELLEITYSDNILCLYYGGADYYEYKNKNGIWFRLHGSRRCTKAKQIELNSIVDNYIGRGVGSNV